MHGLPREPAFALVARLGAVSAAPVIRVALVAMTRRATPTRRREHASPILGRPLAALEGRLPPRRNMIQFRASAAPILFVHHGRDWIRGSERCLIDLIENLDRSRFRPIVWCDAQALADASRAAGVETHHAATMAVDGASLPFTRQAVSDATDLVRRYSVRLIHANDCGPLPALVVAARRASIPVVAQIHLISTDVERRWMLLHQVDLAVGVSHASVEGLLEDGMPAERVTVIYNGIDIDRLWRGAAPTLRAELGIQPTAVVLGLVASLIARKGVDVAINALALVRASGRDVHLVVAGDGEEAGALGALARDRGVSASVHFLGVRGDIGAVLRDACDVLVSAARFESLGLNILEAAACGLPAVVSDIPPHLEAVRAGETALVFPLDDARAMAQAIERLVDDPEARVAMGRAAERRVRAEFALGPWIEAFERTYGALLARPAREFGWTHALTWPDVYTTWARQMIVRRFSRIAGGGGRSTPTHGRPGIAAAPRQPVATPLSQHVDRRI